MKYKVLLAKQWYGQRPILNYHIQVELEEHTLTMQTYCRVSSSSSWCPIASLLKCEPFQA